MVGEIGTNYFYNQGMYNQFNNPFLMPSASAMNDDFMAQSVFGNSLQQTDLANYGNYSNYGNAPTFQGANLQGAPATDTFESSSSQEEGPSLGSKLLTGGAVGGATAAGVYYLGTNPMKDGKVNSSFLEVLNKQNLENAGKLKYDALYAKQANPIYQKVGIAGVEQYEAVQKLAGLTKIEDLPQEVRAKLPASIQTPEAAKNAIEQIKPELEKIDITKIRERVTRLGNPNSLAHHQTRLNQINGLKSQVMAMKPEATVEDLTAFFKNNASAYGIKGTEAEIAQKAGRLANTFGTRDNLLNNLVKRDMIHQVKIDGINQGLKQQFEAHWDKGAKALKEGAPKELGQAVKSFKLQKAGKYGLIAGGVAFLARCLFGGKSEA